MTKSLRRKGFRQKNRKSRKQRVSRKRQMKGGYLKELKEKTLNNPLIMLGLSDKFLRARGKTLESLDERTIITAYRIRSKQLHPDRHILIPDRGPDDLTRADNYFKALTKCKDSLLDTIKLPNDRKIPQLNYWNHDAQADPWINWPFDKRIPADEAVAQHLGEILQLTNGAATVHDNADEDDAEVVEYEVKPDVPTNYNAVVSNLSNEQKQWIRTHYERLVSFGVVQSGLNDYNEILKEIFNFYKL